MFQPRPLTHIAAATQSTHTGLSRWLSTAAISACLFGCAAQSPSGYGLMATQSTAAQAQEQLAAAEQANQPDAAKAYLDLIIQMQQAGQWYASLAHADAFEQQHGARPESSLLRADALRNTGQLDAAKNNYHSLLDTTSKGRALRGLGLLYAGQGQYTEAIAHLDQARQHNPIDASLLSDIAYAHMLNGELNAARIPALQAAQLAPNNARVQLNLALYLLANGQQEDAQRLLYKLSQPPSKGSQPLIDTHSTHMLRNQLEQIQQATLNRSTSAGTSQTTSSPNTVVLYPISNDGSVPALVDAAAVTTEAASTTLPTIFEN